MKKRSAAQSSVRMLHMIKIAKVFYFIITCIPFLRVKVTLRFIECFEGSFSADDLAIQKVTQFCNYEHLLVRKQTVTHSMF